MKSFREWYTFNEGEAKFIDSLDIDRLQRLIFPLITAFVILGAIDVSMTTVALHMIQGAVELNPFAAAMFKLGFTGSMMALGLKFAVPLPTMVYVAALKKHETLHETREAKLLKLTVIGALVIGVAWWGFAVVFDTSALVLGFVH